MDMFVRRCNTESIKNTMEKHEEIFKLQVQELHRLYEVQKFLMAELSYKEVKMNSSNSHILTDDTMIKVRNSTSISGTSLSSHRSAAAAEGLSVPEFSNCSEEHLRTPSLCVLQQATEGESPESCSNDECNLDLTLRIGCDSVKIEGMDRKQIAYESNQLISSNFRGDSGEECTNSSDGYGADSLKRPHWIFGV